LRDSGARYYKLTPALTAEHLQHGHGFHFIVPGKEEPDAFLDRQRRASRSSPQRSSRELTIPMPAPLASMQTCNCASPNFSKPTAVTGVKSSRT
jgi:hypothetical protein